MNKVSRDMADKRAHDYNIELRFIKEYMDKNFGEDNSTEVKDGAK